MSYHIFCKDLQIRFFKTGFYDLTKGVLYIIHLTIYQCFALVYNLCNLCPNGTLAHLKKSNDVVKYTSRSTFIDMIELK